MKEDFKDFIEASGLLNYDPEIISKIYKRNPKRLLKRLWQTLVPIFGYIISVVWDKITGKLKKDSQARYRASELTNLLVELGPAFVKAGQALSTRPDMLGKKTCDELKTLQDKLKPISSSIAKKIIHKEDENFLQKDLDSFEERPIASASVAQVHKGILKNGKKVVVMGKSGNAPLRTQAGVFCNVRPY